MSDFSFLHSETPQRTQRQLQAPNSQHRAHGSGHGAGGANAAAAGAHRPQAALTASSGNSQQQQQQQQPPRPRIQLPSFRQVQAAERPSAPINTFQPGRLAALQQQQQQQQQRQNLHPRELGNAGAGTQQLSRPPAAAGTHASGSSAPGGGSTTSAAGGALTASAAGDASGVASGGRSVRPPPPWAAALPSLGLNTQLPRFSQSAAGASSGAAIGISRPAQQQQHPTSAAAAAAAAGGGGGGGSQLGSGAAGQQAPQAAGSTGGSQQQQQQQLPINAVLVSRRQQGNPVLKHIRSVRWVFADIVPDYLCGQSTAVLFLSLRYHLLQPEYILSRLQALQRAYRMSVLLLLIDAEEVVKPLLELHKAAMGAQAVLVCAWSNEECARYIETFKAYENKPASSIMQHTDTDYMGRLSSALTSIRGVNRSDAYSLARHFGSLADVFRCNDVQDFASIPGLGPVKAKRLLETFQQPFKRTPGATGQSAPLAATTATSTQQHQQASKPQGQLHEASGDDDTVADDAQDDNGNDALSDHDVDAEVGLVDAGLDDVDLFGDDDALYQEEYLEEMQALLEDEELL